MFKWLHHILNPHCPHCMEEAREAKVCNSCEILKEEITRLRFENERLIDKLTTKSEEVKQIIPDDLVALPTTQFKSWQVRREMLEAESRQKAKLMKDLEKNAQPKTIEELESKMGVENAS